MIKCCYQFRILCCNPALNKARLIASSCFTPGMVSNTKLLLRIVHIFSWLTSPTRKIECMCPELSVLPRLEQCVFPYTFFVVVNQSWHTTHRIPEPRFCHKHFRKPPLRAVAIRNAPNDSLANLPTKNVSNFWRNTTYYCGLSWFFLTSIKVTWNMPSYQHYTLLQCGRGCATKAKHQRHCETDIGLGSMLPTSKHETL